MRITHVLLPVVLLLPCVALADDWPTYRRDRLRSAVTPEKLQLPLKRLWSFRSRQSRHAPRPTLEPQRANFPDCSLYTLPVISAGDHVFASSAIEGRVFCLDAASGEMRWQFIAGAAVNRTPMFWEGKIYTGSDDGNVYCLDAASGEIVWTYQAAPTRRLFLAYGRMISVWPVRTDVLVDKGVAYFSAGVFPHEGTFVYALDARTGELLWRNGTQSEDGNQSSLAPGGHLYLTQLQAWVPKDFRGYANLPYGAPTAFRRSNGEHQGWPDPADPERPKIDSNSPWTRIFWPLFGVERDGVRYAGASAWKTENEEKGRQTVWSHDIPGRWVDHDSAVGVRIKGKPVIFRYDPDHSSIVLAGDVLFHTAFDTDPKKAVGSGLYARQLGDGKELWSTEFSDRANQLVVAGGRLFVGTRGGMIHAFAHDGDEHGEIVEEVDDAAPVAGDPLADAAETIIRESGVKSGYALVLDCTSGRLALELARRTNLYVCAVFDNDGAMHEARKIYTAAGLHASRIATWRRRGREKLPYPSFFADLIVSEGASTSGDLPGEVADWSRLLKPVRGIALMGAARSQETAASWVADAAQEGWKIVERDGWWARRDRPRLAGAGGWTHMHGDAGNTSCSHDDVLKAPLGVLWYGPPSVKSPSKHTSLIIDGILVLPDRHSLEACDQYTGRRLWKLDAKGIGASIAASRKHVYARFDKFLAQIDLLTGKHLTSFLTPFGKEHGWGWYAAAGDGKTIYGAAAGGFFATETESGKGNVLWTVGGPGSEEKIGGATAMSDGLIHVLGGEVQGEMRDDAIQAMRAFFSTQTAELREEFESQVAKRDIRRLTTIDASNGKILYRTGVDISNCGGKWLRGASFGSRGHYNPYVFLDIYARNGTVVIGSASRADKGWRQWNSGAYKTRALTAYDARTGKLLWYRCTNHRTRPVIVNDTIHAEPWAYDLRSGRKKTRVHPITGEEADWAWCRFDKQCGVFSASSNLLFGRNKGFGYQDLANDQGIYTFWHSRSNCYVDHVSGGGLMIKPPQAIYCKCMWSLPFTVAMGEVPRPPPSAPKFAQPGPNLPVKHLHLDFGSNGDRRDAKGRLWLSSTNRPVNHKLLLGYDVRMLLHDGGKDLRRSSMFTHVENADVPFVFATAILGLKRCVLPIVREEDGPGRYKVRLGFVAPRGDVEGRRVFDVRLGGKTVIADLDVVKEAGGAEIAMWREFTLEIDGDLVLDLVCESDSADETRLPLISGLEVLREEVRELGFAAPHDTWLNFAAPEKTLTMRIANLGDAAVRGRIVLDAPNGIDAKITGGDTIDLAPSGRTEVEVSVKASEETLVGRHEVGIRFVDSSGGARLERAVPVEWMSDLERRTIHGGSRTVMEEQLRQAVSRRVRPRRHNEAIFVSRGARKPNDGGAATSYLWFHVPGELRGRRIHAARLRLHRAPGYDGLQGSTSPVNEARRAIVKRIPGPPWPDVNKIEPESLPQTLADARELHPLAGDEAVLEAALPGALEVDVKDGNIYLVIEPTALGAAAYWGGAATDRDKAPMLILDFEKASRTSK